jgi:isoquinoline 1-oxidoreductase beta subunit
VAPATLDIADGTVIAADGRRAPIGTLVSAAAALPLPAAPALRPAARYRYQKRKVPRIDLPAKVRGEARYSFDFKLPDMLYACARLAPAPGAILVGRDDSAARKVPGVVDVVALPSGVAVVATSQYAAMRGAEAMEVHFGPSPRAAAAQPLEPAMRAALADDASARVAVSTGDVAAAFAAAGEVIERDYVVPFLAHAPMEPWSCTVRRTATGLEIWAPTQGQDRVRTVAAETAGLSPDAIVVHTINPGGGFGRRLVADGVPDAVRVAMATDRPVKFFWTREDEFAQANCRPAQAARLRAALAADGRIAAIHIRVAGPSIREVMTGPLGPKDFDWGSMQNLPDIRYGWANARYDNVVVPSPAPIAPWRAVGATHNAVFVEGFMDALAAKAGMDPVAFRLKQLSAADPRQARAIRVIEEAAARGRWSAPVPKGHARGFAYFECYGSLCAQVAEVALRDGAIRLVKVTSVLDCGETIMPDQARQQVEGGIIQGASAAMFEAVTLAAGAPEQRNFDSYRVLRIDEAPAIECHFIESGERIGGVGEPPVPPVMAAISNAVARLTGKPVVSQPIVRA